MKKLGKAPAVFDNSLPLAKTFKLLAPIQLPASIDWSVGISQVPMLGNDTVGDCAFATSLHAVQFITQQAGAPEMPTAQCAILDYSKATGYNPITGEYDNGIVLLDKNRYWMQNGLAITSPNALEKLEGFAQIEAADIDALMRSLFLFGPTELGVELPPDAEDAYDQTHTWDDVSGAYGGLGGHDTLVVGYYDFGAWFKIATWGGYVIASRAWISKYMSEGTAFLMRKWLNPITGISPSQLTWRELDDLIVEQHGIVSSDGS
jgi:hypothetical protein